MKSMYPSSYQYNGPTKTCALDVIYFPYLALVRFEQSMSQGSLLTAYILCQGISFQGYSDNKFIPLSPYNTFGNS